MRISIIFILAVTSMHTYASSIEDCILNYVGSAGDNITIAQIKQKCQLEVEGVKLPERLIKEKISENNPFVISPHHTNYILPVTYNASPNQEPYEQQNLYPGIDEPIDDLEATLQLSLKVPLSYVDLLTQDDGIYFGFTLRSFWQVYNKELSAPFRETNYRPEIFYQAPIPHPVWGGLLFARAGIEHQSNGRSQLLSRSWNRLFVGLGFQKDNWAIYLQPWYRLPEDAKEDDGDPTTPPPPEGDDNPDIDDFMGYQELIGVYDYKRLEITGMSRYNFSTGKGALEVGMSFPLWGRLRGYVQYFNGYGESLIDYNHQTERIGLGFLLTELL